MDNFFLFLSAQIGILIASGVSYLILIAIDCLTYNDEKKTLAWLAGIFGMVTLNVLIWLHSSGQTLWAVVLIFGAFATMWIPYRIKYIREEKSEIETLINVIFDIIAILIIVAILVATLILTW